MHRETGNPGITHFRLLADAMEELCSARTPDDVVRISAAVARRACGVDGVWVRLSTGELLERVVPYQLRGTPRLDFSSDGARCTIVIPLTAENAVVGTAAADD